MRVLLLVCGLGLSAGLACGGDPGTPDLGDGGRGGDGRHDGRGDGWFTPFELRIHDGEGGECDGLGNQVRLTFVVKGLDLTATDVQSVNGSKGLIGFAGLTTDNRRFWLGRHGDAAAAAFNDVRVYDASRAPYHMLLQLWPASSGSACAGNSACETYFGLNGVWRIATSTAPTAGTYIISGITQQEGCWQEKPSGPADATGCPIVGGTVYGCFKVN